MADMKRRGFIGGLLGALGALIGRKPAVADLPVPGMPVVPQPPPPVFTPPPEPQSLIWMSGFSPASLADGLYHYSLPPEATENTGRLRVEFDSEREEVRYEFFPELDGLDEQDYF